MEIDGDLRNAVNCEREKFGGKVYSNGSESIFIAILPGYLDYVDLDRCAEIVGTEVMPIALIEDQFDSLLLISKTGDIYLCFIDGEDLSIEPYAKSLREAIGKALNVNACLLWMYCKREKSERSNG